MARMKKQHARRGISIVEGAFMIPILIMLIFGAIEFGSLLHMRHTMLHAAREAARTMAVEDGTAAQAIAVANNILPSGNLDFDVDAQLLQADQFAQDVQVQISVPMTQAALGDMFGFFGTRAMSVQVTMRSEQ
tara:strand:- start:204 stop:602 length:399 start_codon:yes stop_codon:yes gene_type:complete